MSLFVKEKGRLPTYTVLLLGASPPLILPILTITFSHRFCYIFNRIQFELYKSLNQGLRFIPDYEITELNKMSKIREATID